MMTWTKYNQLWLNWIWSKVRQQKYGKWTHNFYVHLNTIVFPGHRTTNDFGGHMKRQFTMKRHSKPKAFWNHWSSKSIGHAWAWQAISPQCKMSPSQFQIADTDPLTSQNLRFIRKPNESVKAKHQNIIHLKHGPNQSVDICGFFTLQKHRRRDTLCRCKNQRLHRMLAAVKLQEPGHQIHQVWPKPASLLAKQSPKKLKIQLRKEWNVKNTSRIQGAIACYSII